jgi:hypothetical protein
MLPVVTHPFGSGKLTTSGNLGESVRDRSHRGKTYRLFRIMQTGSNPGPAAPAKFEGKFETKGELQPLKRRLDARTRAANIP